MSQTSPGSTIVSESSVSSNSVKRDDQENGNAHPPLSPSEVVEVAKEKKQVSKSYAEHLSKSNAGILFEKKTYRNIEFQQHRKGKLQ